MFDIFHIQKVQKNQKSLNRIQNNQKKLNDVQKNQKIKIFESLLGSSKKLLFGRLHFQ